MENHKENRGSNVFDLYSGKQQRRRSDEGSGGEDGLMEYAALAACLTPDDLRGSEEWFRIYREPPRLMEMVRYDDVQHVFCPDSTTISITLRDEQGFILHGHAMDLAAMYIQDRKLKAMELFLPGYHRPPEKDEPIITYIERLPELVGDVGDEPV